MRSKQSTGDDMQSLIGLVIGNIAIHLPFSYMWFLKRSIKLAGGTRTVLDLGCGDGTLMGLLSRGEGWRITGVDIYKKVTERARKSNIYIDVVRGDMLKTITGGKLKSRYDVVFFSQAIEHIKRKDGEKILAELERLARKRIIVGTPRGFMEQPHEFLDNSPYQVHKSGWSVEDFISRGYRVYGVGFWPVWSYNGLARNGNLLTKVLSNIISYLMSPIVLIFPGLGSGVVAIKEK